MRTRYGASYWIDRYPKNRLPSFPTLRGLVEADVAVLGGGLTGCAVASAFALAGIRVALVEPHRIADSCAGLRPGLLRSEPPVSFTALLERYGRTRARTIWIAYRRASQDLQATIRRLGLRCEYLSDAALRVALTPTDADDLEREHAALRKAGLDGTWLTTGRVKLETGVSGLGAVRATGDGYVDPYRLALGLLDAAVARRALIVDQTGPVHVRRHAAGVELQAAGGLVTARTVVVASSDLPRGFAPLQRHVTRAEACCVVTGQVPSFVRREFGRSRATLVVDDGLAVQVRRTADNRLIGVGEATGRVPARLERRTLETRCGAVMHEMTQLYPALSGVRPEFAWHVPLSLTADRLPLVGPHQRYPGHLFALGIGQGGLGAAWLAARALVRQYRGATTTVDDWLGFARLR